MLCYVFMLMLCLLAMFMLANNQDDDGDDDIMIKQIFNIRAKLKKEQYKGNERERKNM